MNPKCPNCRGEAKRTEVTTGQVYIECAQCGLFEVQPDGSFVAGDAAEVQSALSPPGDGSGTSPHNGDGAAAVDAAPSEKTDEAAARPAKSTGGDSTPALSPPPAGDEDGEIDITFTDETEY